MILLARMERTVHFRDKEKGSGLWGFGRNDSSGLQMFVDESLACFLFLQVERIYLSDLWNKRGLKVNGVVICMIDEGEGHCGLSLRRHLLDLSTSCGFSVQGLLQFGPIPWTR